MTPGELAFAIVEEPRAVFIGADDDLENGVVVGVYRCRARGVVFEASWSREDFASLAPADAYLEVRQALTEATAPPKGPSVLSVLETL